MNAPTSTNSPVSRRLASLLGNLAIVGIVYFGVTAFQTRDMLHADRRPAPGLSATTLDGAAYDLATAKGRPVVVYFFAPWCKVCAASADNLVRLRRWRDEGDLEIVSVALDWDSVDELRAYSNRHELNLPVVLGDAQLSRDWQIYAFPTYYVLDSNLRVVGRDLGYSTWFGLWWRSRLAD